MLVALAVLLPVALTPRRSDAGVYVCVYGSGSSATIINCAPLPDDACETKTECQSDPTQCQPKVLAEYATCADYEATASQISAGVTTQCADLKTKLKAADASCQDACATGYTDKSSEGLCVPPKKCCVKAATVTNAPTGPAYNPPPQAQFAMPNLDPADFIGRIVRLIFGITGSIAFAMIVYGGFLWLTSGGSPEIMNKAKNVVVWAVLGIVIVFTAYAIVSNVLKFVFQAVTAVPK